MSAFYGILLFTGYFSLLSYIARITADMSANWILVIYAVTSVAGAIMVIKFQTFLERKLIQRHVRKNPGSSWASLATKF